MEMIRVTGEASSLESIRHFVRDAATRAGLDKKQCYGLELAIDEIATNIVYHGYREAGRAGEILVRVSSDDAAVTTDLEDTGVPFDPRQLRRPPQVDLPIADRPVGGLGVFLAMESVDEYRYEYVDGQNRNSFVVRRRVG